MWVLRWGLDLEQLYANGGGPPCVSASKYFSLTRLHASSLESLEGTGVATSNSGPLILGMGAEGGGGGLLQWNGYPRVFDIPIPKTLVYGHPLLILP